MNPIKGAFEKGLEKLEEGAKQQVKTVVQDMKSQVAAGNSGSTDAGSHESGGGTSSSQAQSDHATKDFIKELYAPSQNNQQHGQKQPSQFFQDQLHDGKTPEEAQKMEALRRQLHNETYYIPLTQRKPHEVELQEEEQEKEQKKMEDLKANDEKKQSDQPIAVQMGANSAEQFRGASG